MHYDLICTVVTGHPCDFLHFGIGYEKIHDPPPIFFPNIYDPPLI